MYTIIKPHVESLTLCFLTVGLTLVTDISLAETPSLQQLMTFETDKCEATFTNTLPVKLGIKDDPLFESCTKEENLRAKAFNKLDLHYRAQPSTDQSFREAFISSSTDHTNGDSTTLTISREQLETFENVSAPSTGKSLAETIKGYTNIQGE